jgi:DNA (cytosine-5)-methyltransferase 1
MPAIGSAVDGTAPSAAAGRSANNTNQARAVPAPPAGISAAPSCQGARGPIAFGSVCSGIGAPECAWQDLGWRHAFASEIEPFPRAVLAHRFPGVPVHGDFTTIEAGQYEPIDVLVGGTPCQSFSVAGLRKGLADDRGNLALEYLRLADRLRPRWLVWENVPGVLSSNGGRDFGAFLGGLGQLGYGFAYRVLDAQHFGVAQRRRRVFVVGYLGDWRRAAAVLFEPASLRGDSAPRREPGEGVADTLTVGANQCSGGPSDFTEVARCLTGHPGRSDGETETFVSVSPALRAQSQSSHRADSEAYVAHTLRADGFDASEDSTGRGTPLVPVSFPWQQGGTMPTPHDVDLCGTLVKNQTQAAQIGAAVRRLTPRECERLQGFPDDWTAVTHRRKPAADGPRYKALGNSMAVPVLRWIGERIARQEAEINPIPATAGDPSRRFPGIIVDEQCVVVSSLNLAAPDRSGAAFFGGGR